MTLYSEKMHFFNQRSRFFLVKMELQYSEKGHCVEKISVFSEKGTFQWKGTVLPKSKGWVARFEGWWLWHSYFTHKRPWAQRFNYVYFDHFFIILSKKHKSRTGKKQLTQFVICFQRKKFQEFVIFLTLLRKNIFKFFIFHINTVFRVFPIFFLYICVFVSGTNPKMIET